MADAAGESAAGAGHGESHVAGIVWHGLGLHFGRFWRRGRNAVASGTARLVGGGIPRVRLGRETLLQNAGAVGDVSAIRLDHAGETGEGSAEPVAVAWSALSHGRRNDSRSCI